MILKNSEVASSEESEHALVFFCSAVRTWGEILCIEIRLCLEEWCTGGIKCHARQAA